MAPLVSPFERIALCNISSPSPHKDISLSHDGRKKEGHCEQWVIAIIPVSLFLGMATFSTAAGSIVYSRGRRLFAVGLLKVLIWRCEWYKACEVGLRTERRNSESSTGVHVMHIVSKTCWKHNNPPSPRYVEQHSAALKIVKFKVF